MHIYSNKAWGRKQKITSNYCLIRSNGDRRKECKYRELEKTEHTWVHFRGFSRAQRGDDVSTFLNFFAAISSNILLFERPRKILHPSKWNSSQKFAFGGVDILFSLVNLAALLHQKYRTTEHKPEMSYRTFPVVCLLCWECSISLLASFSHLAIKWRSETVLKSSIVTVQLSGWRNE